jgi:hypothetical protein
MRVLFVVLLQLMIFQSVAQIGRGGGLSSETKSKKASEALEKDTTGIYGPQSTSSMKEAEWFLEINQLHTLDTGITNLHRYTIVAENNYAWQDLGTVGTAAQPIYFRAPMQLGPRVGINAYNYYSPAVEDVKYYNTYSRFSEMYYVQGAQGRSILNVRLAQNIKPHWSASIRYFRTNTRPIVGQQARGRNSRQTTLSNFTATTRYYTPNGRYRLLAHAHQANQRTPQETGGIFYDSLTQIQEFNDSTLFARAGGQLSNQLTDFGTSSTSYRGHLYHELHIKDSSAVKLFHSATFTRQFFTSNAGTDVSGNTRFLQQFIPDSSGFDAEPQVQLVARTTRNRLGLKLIGNNSVLAGWAGLRTFDYRQVFVEDLQEDTITVNQELEWFPSVGAAFYKTLVRDSVEWLKVFAQAEALSADEYRAEAVVNFKQLELSLEEMRYRPAQIEQSFLVRGFRWQNNFSNTRYRRAKLSANLPFGSGGSYVQLGAEHTQLDQLVYMNEFARPQQLDGSFSYNRLSLLGQATTGKIGHRVQAWYTSAPDSAVIRMPELLASYQLFYRNALFNKAIYLEAGLDFNWSSQFAADAWFPLTQQFHLQNNQLLGEYLLTDLFINMRVQRFRLFIKISNLLANLPKPQTFGIFEQVTNNTAPLEALFKPGYFASPNYMGMGRSLEFGIHWYFFN